MIFLYEILFLQVIGLNCVFVFSSYRSRYWIDAILCNKISVASDVQFFLQFSASVPDFPFQEVDTRSADKTGFS